MFGLNNKKRNLKIASTLVGVLTLTGCSPFQSVESLTNLDSSFGRNNGLTIDGDQEITATSSKLQITGFCFNGTEVIVEGDVQGTRSQCQEGQFSANVTFNPPDGLKTIRVKQLLENGKEEIRIRSYELDSTPPDLQILNPSNQEKFSNSVVVNGICENGSYVKVGEASAAMLGEVDCQDGTFATTLPLTQADGSVVLVTEQADKVGNTVRKEIRVQKDTQAPQISISSPSQGQQVGQKVQVRGTCESGLLVTIGGQGTASSTTTNCTNRAYQAEVVLQNSLGNKMITVTQTDAAQNMGQASRTVSMMAQGPSVAITSPVENSLFNGQFRVQGTCTNGFPVRAEVSDRNGNRSVNCSSGRFNIDLDFRDADGAKTLVVSQTDSLGQVGAASRTFIKDTQAPQVAIAKPTSGQVFGANGNVALVGTCEDGLTVSISGSGLSGNSTTNCNLGSFSRNVTLSSGDGSKQIRVSQTDGLNPGQATVTVSRDSNGPMITITSPEAGFEAEDGVKIIGGCESNLKVRASGSGVQAPTEVNCSNQKYEMDVLFSDGIGEKVITLSQTDSAGNQGTVSRAFTRKAPDVVVPTHDGVNLYANNCANCHSPLPQTRVLGATFDQINFRIANQPQMKHLTFLTKDQTCAISDALGGDTYSDCTQKPDPNPPQAAEAFLCRDESLKAPDQIKRLTRTEYRDTLLDIFSSELLSSELESFLRIMPTEQITKTDIFESFSQGVTYDLVVSYQRVAENVVNELVGSNSWKQAQLGSTCASQNNLSQSCLNRLFDSLELRVFRRPLDSSIKQLYQNHISSIQGNLNQKLTVVLQAMLQSPHFIYKIEEIKTPLNGVADTYRLDNYEIASRLSFAITGQTPSSALLQAASRGELTTSNGYNQWVDQLLASNDSRNHFQKFYKQWLDVDSLDNSDHPSWYLDGVNSGSLSKDITEDFESFFDYIVWDRQGSYSDLMTSTQGFVKTSNMSKIYGRGIASNPVDLGSNRTGILSRPALSYNPNQNISIVHRGVVIRNNVLCQEIPEPNPTDFPEGTLDPVNADEQTSSREAIEVKTSPTTCQGCHSFINPMGFAMQNYDAIGRFRQFETIHDQMGDVLAQHPIDASAASPKIDGPNEPAVDGARSMSLAIAKSQAGPKCMTQRYLEFVQGRKSQEEDNCQLRGAYNQLKGQSVQEMMKNYLSSDNFKLKKSE